MQKCFQKQKMILRGRVDLALLLEQVLGARAVDVRGRNIGPAVDTVEDGKGHATVGVGLDVAVEEPGTGKLDLVAEGDPGAVALGGRRGEAVTDWILC